MIYLLYGQPGSGKTTLGNRLAKHLRSLPFNGCDPVMIDGDEFRKLFINKNYSKRGRYQNIRNANAVATYADKVLSRDVIVTLVNPYQLLRDELKLNNRVTDILLVSTRSLRKEYHVQDFETGSPSVTINTDERLYKTWLFLKKHINV